MSVGEPLTGAPGPDSGADGPEPGRPHGLRRLRRRIKAHRALDATYRISVLVVGGAVIAAGLAMLLLPGPGWAAIFIGLAILGSEFAWARRLLDRAKAWVKDMADRATDPRVRRRNQLVLAGAVAGALALGWWYLDAMGVPAFASDTWNALF